MGNAIVGKSDNKSRSLGDDPLAWLNADADASKKTSKTKPGQKTKKNKKTQKTGSEKSKPKKIKSEKKNKTAKTVTNEASSTNQFVLESSLIINNASDVYESLKKLVVNGQAVEIDASKVEVIDSAILQLFLSFVLKLKENDVKISWYKPTEGLLNKASILGLTEQLGL